MRARVAVATALLALTTAPSAYAGQKPNGQELWRAYPLKPKASATAATPTASAARTPARAPANGGGDGSWAPIALAGLAAAAAAGAAATLARRRRARAVAEPAPAAAAPSPRFTAHTAERLRAAVDIRLAREWPWPADSEGLWRCEIGPDPGALSARFRAIVHSPDDEPPRVLAVSATGPAGRDWQSAEPLEQAVNALAAQLEADGWDPVESGGDPHTRRFCWRREGAPHGRLRETAWSA
jgi:hypothetical protein